MCLFHDGGRYNIETSPLICSANQWTNFYMITAHAMKELSDTEAELKKSVLLKKGVYEDKSEILGINKKKDMPILQ